MHILINKLTGLENPKDLVLATEETCITLSLYQADQLKAQVAGITESANHGSRTSPRKNGKPTWNGGRKITY